MAANKNRVWVVKQQPVGLPVLGKDVELQERDAPTITDEGQFIAKVTWISLDPFIRGTLNEVSYGQVQAYPRIVTCYAVGRVIESRNMDYPVGTVITGLLGCQEYFLFDPSKPPQVNKVPEGVKESHAVGVLGMPGATAFFGLLNVGCPKEGETIAVSSAAGAVGALVTQIGKIKGCRVVGIAGGKDKCDFVKSLGADACIDYKGKSVKELTEALKEAAPSGIDVYFDNTGGPCTEAVFANLNSKARVAVCGQIAYYNMTPEELSRVQGTPMTFLALRKALTVRGFFVREFPDWSVAFADLGSWIKEGKLTVKEDVKEGFENFFDALLTLYNEKGTNFGKAVLKL